MLIIENEEKRQSVGFAGATHAHYAAASRSYLVLFLSLSCIALSVGSDHKLAHHLLNLLDLHLKTSSLVAVQ